MNCHLRIVQTNAITFENKRKGGGGKNEETLSIMQHGCGIPIGHIE